MITLNRTILSIAFFLAIIIGPSAQPIDSLRLSIENIISTKNAKVGVAIIGPEGKDTLSIHGHHHFPMQSVFKFHIALTVLSQVDQGKLSLDQIIRIDSSDLFPTYYSPIRDKYPEGGDLTIAEILQYTVSKSDNVGCDLLLALVGGPEVVQTYITTKGFEDFSVKINEQVMQSNWDMQFLNWTTPVTSSKILFTFFKNEPQLLSPDQHAFLWKTMIETETGKNRLKGNLPSNTIVAHKTGWSGSNPDGITAAVNDIGVVIMPDGRLFFISVFITDSREDLATNEKIIADIAKAAWEFFDGASR